jgi:uncharacterized membrane protein YfhO
MTHNEAAVSTLMTLLTSLFALTFVCSGLMTIIEWLQSPSPKQSYFKWLLDIKPYDSGWKVTFLILSFVVLVIPYFIVRAIYGMFYEFFAMVLCMPFNWEFSHYLQGEERVKYTTWWRDCTEGGWRVFVGPFGITRIVRSVCR